MQQFVVLGLGVFGSKVAKTLTENGAEVVAIDRNSDCVNRISTDVTRAVKGDVTDIEFLKTLGIDDFDCGIVAMGEHVEESLLGVMNLKEIGIPVVLAKSKNNRFELVLEKVGATKVVRPEKEMGEKIARQLMFKNILDLTDIDDSHSVCEFAVPSKWANKSILDLNLGQTYGINVLGKKENGKLSVNLDINAPLSKGETLVLIAPTDEIQLLDLKLD